MGAEIILLDSKALQELKKEIRQDIEVAVQNAVKALLENLSSKSDWLNKDEAMRLLAVKKSRLQELRNEGAIVFSQRPGSKKILYSRSSILEYLENYKQEKI